MSTSETPPLPNHYQFRIRHLLIAMVVAGVIMAITAPLARTFSPNQWKLIGTYCVGFALGLGLFTAVVLVPRRYARERAGMPLVELDDIETPFDVLMQRIGFSVFAFANLVLFILLWNRSRPLRSFDDWWTPIFGSAVAAFVLGIYFAPPHAPQLRQNGLLWGAYFTPWNKLKVIRGGWLDPLYLRISYIPIRKVRIRADQREQVETILRERMRLSDDNGNADFSA